MKTSSLLIAAVIIILMLPAVLLSIDDFRLVDQKDPFNVTTAAGVTSANITLSQDLYGGNTANAAVSSNETDDAPIAASYTTATNVLNITGLVESNTRRLDVTYSIDRLGDYFGAATGSKVLPILMILGILCIVGGAGYAAWNRHGGD